MLRLENITKNYYTATETVAALRGISLAFRKNEFVSVLGPSGCGKTTLLNLIGGLDCYTGGDLFIRGRSTAEFRDRDWDVYRNHRVGFIFQSYNLIPHQTILQNVELALTIAGISREERVRRAKATLDRVGLAGMYGKRPNQLSGGQCQRVAIARALVNDPEILLADEPTGALDTVTSGQIMDLIREIAGERLVIMVTHNPELAEEYSTRIIRLLDGRVIEDTNPFAAEDEIAECEQLLAEEAAAARAEEEAMVAAGDSAREVKKAAKRRREKAKMSFFTAFRLSARNLLSKRRRTALVGFAGSIGIIGIAMVLAISAGIRGYVASMQDDMLSGNPIEITKSTYDLSALTSMMSFDDKLDIVRNPNSVYVNSLIEYLAETAETMENLMIHNDLSADYTDYVLSMPEEYRAAILVNWGMDLSHSIYTSQMRADGTVARPSITALTASYTSMIEATEFREFASYATSLGQLMAEAPNNRDYILSQYDVLEGKIAEERNEVMLVVSPNTELTDIVLAKLGYYTEEEFLNLVRNATDDPLYDESLRKPEFSYDELVGKEMTFYPNDAIYTQNPLYASSPLGSMIYNYAADVTDIPAEKAEDGLTLKVVGILRPKDSISFGCLTSGLYYTKALSDYARSVNYDSAIASALRESGQDALTGGDAQLTMETPMGSTSIPLRFGVSFEYGYLDPATGNRVDGEVGYVGGSIFASMDMSDMMGSMMGGGSGTGSGGTAGGGSESTSGISFPDPYSLSSLTLAALGGAEKPTSFAIYPTDFDSKDLVTAWLDVWNSDEDVTLSDGRILKAADRSHVTYTDTLSLIIALINSMIDVVSTALICFTSVSLVVSTVMIGILTYVSVVERIKEIGVIRSLGGRKRDVRHLFNAETFIIGFLAGLIGVLITVLLALLLNVIIKVLADVTVTAYLPLGQAIALIALSVGLTLISGLIPASAAANKDPVNALRSE
ncbi:MAG: ABC transporter ATP-binding protein/permease [Clostridia bacterium]|nr:ABC transporter ATP-binding protein/permease [Clostridia bacterium]